MNALQLKTVGAVAVPAVATMLFVQACGGGGWAIANDISDPMEGVWEAQVTLRDCSTGATLGSFRGAQVLHHGGTLSDTNTSPPGSRGPGFGVWARNVDGRYGVKFRFYRYNADGTPAGVTVVHSTRMLGADGNTYTGDNRAELRDLAGNALSTNCVIDEGTRFR